MVKKKKKKKQPIAADAPSCSADAEDTTYSIQALSLSSDLVVKPTDIRTMKPTKSKTWPPQTYQFRNGETFLIPKLTGVAFS